MICSKGHSFESTAKVRAFCPECGELTRRFTEAEPEEQPESPEEQGSAEAPAKAGNGDEVTSEAEPEEEPPKAVRLKPKVVKVTAKRRAQPVKKKILKQKRGAKPEIKLRVKTNLEKKIAKETRHKDTHWEQICKVGWFG